MPLQTILEQQANSNLKKGTLNNVSGITSNHQESGEDVSNNDQSAHDFPLGAKNQSGV